MKHNVLIILKSGKEIRIDCQQSAKEAFEAYKAGDILTSGNNYIICSEIAAIMDLS